MKKMIARLGNHTRDALPTSLTRPVIYIFSLPAVIITSYEMYFSLNNDILQLIVPILYGIYTPVRIVFIQNIRDSTGVAFAHLFIVAFGSKRFNSIYHYSAKNTFHTM